MTDVQATFTDENGKQRLTGTISGNFGGSATLAEVLAVGNTVDGLAIAGEPAAGGAGGGVIILGADGAVAESGGSIEIDAGGGDLGGAGAVGANLFLGGGGGGGVGGTASLNGGRGNQSNGGSAQVVGGEGKAGKSGGSVYLSAGSGDDGNDPPAVLELQPGDGVGGGGELRATIHNNQGDAGQALVSDGNNGVVWGGLGIAAGVPVGAPDGLLPIAIDTTAVTGGAYYWSGAAWVKFADAI